MSKKRQNGGQISQKALLVLFSLQWDRLLSEGSHYFFTMIFHSLEAKTSVFFIVHTRYRRSYKLSVENILNHCSTKHA